MTARLEVVAGIIRDSQGRFLLSQRPPHKHQGGRWEFPGGKLEAGETPAQALTRELEEELGIQVLDSMPFMTIHHDYPELSVRLMFRQVTGWQGEPHGREQQPLGRFSLPQLSQLAFPEANRPVVRALQLPDYLLITPARLEDNWRERLAAAVEAGARLVYARLGGASEADYRALVSQAQKLGAEVMIADDLALARAVGADGLHLTRAGQRRGSWPEDWQGWRSMACHDASGLALARRWQADLVMLSPVQATASHTDARPIGWDALAGLACGQPFSVYALGGVSPDDLSRAREYGARGVAGIRAFW